MDAARGASALGATPAPYGVHESPPERGHAGERQGQKIRLAVECREYTPLFKCGYVLKIEREEISFTVEFRVYTPLFKC